MHPHDRCCVRKVKLKLSSKTGYTKADDGNDLLWLLKTLEDIMVNSEGVKPKTLAIDHQMERITRLKQGESIANKGFLKIVMKELKVFKNITVAIFCGERHRMILCKIN